MGKAKMQNLVRLAAVSTIWAMPVTAAKAAVEYTITNLGIGSGQTFGSTTANSINNNGEVVINSAANPVLYNGGYTTITNPGGTLTQVNDSGLAVGYSNANQAVYTTATHTVNTLAPLPTGRSAYAYGVSPTGGFGTATIVGTSDVISGGNDISQAVTWTGSGTVTGLTPSNAGWDTTSAQSAAIAFAINHSGVIVGQATTAGLDQPDAFITSGTAFKDISPVGSTVSAAEAINAGSMAVGSSDVGAFVYSPTGPGTTTLLPPLGGDVGAADAQSINMAGVIVGDAELPHTENGPIEYDAVIYTPIARAYGITDLNSLIDPNSGWVLQDATSINDIGDIVGFGTYDDGVNGPQQDAFLLTPVAVPEPTSVALVIGAGLFLLGRRRAR